MTELAYITFDQSRYADRLGQLLSETGIDSQEFESLDYFGLLPFFVLAGASVRTHMEAHGDHSHFQGVTLEIPPELEEAFYAQLPEYLEQAYGEAE
jgi:hypothetical protein